MKIAFTGVFDLENYGDHLFPVVFKNEIDKRGINAEIYLFSCVDTKVSFNQEKRIYSMDSLEKMHREEKFDAIVIGGGEIIHFYQFEHEYNDETIIYPMFKIWTIPAFVSEKYGIPLIWNNPGIPFEFDETFEKLSYNVLKYSAYVSVRNQFSVNCIRKCGVEREVVCNPDTAFMLNKIFDSESLNTIRKSIVKSDRYIIFHASKLMPSEEYEKVINDLIKLKEDGYDIVLTPLAYTNYDDVFLKTFNEKSGNKFICIDKKLDIEEIVSIFSGCSGYIGFSFHGAISAYCFNKPIVAYDYACNHKTEDLFGMLDLSDNYSTNANDLYERITNAISNKTDNDNKLKIIQESLDKHFDKVFSTINSYEKQINDEIWNDFSDFIGKSSDLLNKYRGQSFEFMLKEEQYRQQIAALKNRIDVLEELNNNSGMKKRLKNKIDNIRKRK